MEVFGLLFVLIGLVNFVLTVVLRVHVLAGVWNANGVPVSRLGDSAWSVCFLSWGLAMLLPPREVAVTWLAGVMLGSFFVLLAAGLYDQHQHRRRHGRRPPRGTG